LVAGQGHETPQLINGQCLDFDDGKVIVELSSEKMASPKPRRNCDFAIATSDNPRNVILVAGKGHETSQLISGQCLDFDDGKVIAELSSDKMASTKPR
jgi:UDP-N-acetylmuramyl tripeptide synthase